MSKIYSYSAKGYSCEFMEVGFGGQTNANPFDPTRVWYGWARATFVVERKFNKCNARQVHVRHWAQFVAHEGYSTPIYLN